MSINAISVHATWITKILVAFLVIVCYTGSHKKIPQIG